MPNHIATRAEGLARLAAFQPRMGQAYAHGRNYDRGPGAHRDVSQLSPYLRRRLVSEVETIATALKAHGPEASDKFVQEVLWRGYFKGWLEHRPGIWDAYRSGLAHDLAGLETDPEMQARVGAAETGQTGLPYFDAWVHELQTTGYLHNHARMWFASIWIFTLGLPWRIGADFFLRHLLDGDPASNTCSWRWVAGLHTPGKTYRAEAWNIAKFTEHRFAPHDRDLSDDAEALIHQEPEGLPQTQPLRAATAPQPGVPTALLLTEEDCQIKSFDLAALDVRGVAALFASHLRSPRPVPDHVCAFEQDAIADAAERAGLRAKPFCAEDSEALLEWADTMGARQIAMPYTPIGPLRDWVMRLQPKLQAKGIKLSEFQRDWDRIVWPHATAGFFKVKKKMPQILLAAGLM
jgi:hypothetical protein